ncbi:hypothetical protein V6L77_17195 [Pannonibacter sp. Pt2-lr]
MPSSEPAQEGATVSAPQGMQNTAIKGLEPLVRETLPTEVPDEIRINRTGKGDRFMSMAPDRECWSRPLARSIPWPASSETAARPTCRALPSSSLSR